MSVNVYDLTSLCFEMSNKYHRVSEGRCWQASLHTPLSAPQSVVPIWSLSFNWLRDTWIVDSTENFISTSCYSTAGSDSGNYRTPPHQRPGHLFVFLKTWQQIQSYSCKMITKKPQTVTLYGLCSVSKALGLKHICTIYMYKYMIMIDAKLFLNIWSHLCTFHVFKQTRTCIFIHISCFSHTWCP